MKKMRTQDENTNRQNVGEVYVVLAERVVGVIFLPWAFWITIFFLVIGSLYLESVVALLTTNSPLGKQPNSDDQLQSIETAVPTTDQYLLCNRRAAFLHSILNALKHPQIYTPNQIRIS